MSPYRITSVTGRCRRELCVVCPAPAATSSTSPELLHRQKHPPNQTSRLLSVFRRLIFPSPLPAPTAMASPSFYSADEPEEYTGPQERSHSFVSAYVMHCLKLPATLSSCSPLRLQVRSKLMFKLEF